MEGKTLILEAAAKTLSEREDTEVVFIMGLGEVFIAADYGNGTKEWDGVLDIMLR